VPSIHNLWFHCVDRVRTTNDRTFWIGFAGAAMLHVALIFGASSSTPRQLGEKDGLQDAINVDFVEPSALADNAGPHEGEASAEPSSNSALQVPRPAADTDAWQTSSTPDKPKEPSTVEEKPQQQAMLTRPDPEAQQEQTEAQKETPKETHKELQKESQKETQKAQKETQKPATPKSPATKDKHASAPLDLSLPSNLFNAPVGGGSAVTRPAGITRSGENDDFGRDVIRALRKTMPAENTTGRVTVRFALTPNGDLVDLQMVKGSGNPYLDQAVVFAVRQSVFPFPPKGSTAVDRVFMVTYIYQ